MANKARKHHHLRKFLAAAVLAVLLAGALAVLAAWMVVLRPNIDLKGQETKHLYIPTGSNFGDVMQQLEDSGLVRNSRTFRWLARRKNYPNKVSPGRYLLHHRMGNNELINLLRSGRQDPVRVTFNNIRTREQLAGTIARQVEADSASLIRLLNDVQVLEPFGKTPETSVLLFLPNTYEFYWNTGARQFLERMGREYGRFWNEERRGQAAAMGLTPDEVGILASIVQAETNRVDEMDRVAGVYINRLRRNMPLQADPTVVFALGDFSIRRVLNRHLAFDSPYNTYLYPGLPPGPINLPGPEVIDRVLQYERHDYLFFCAKDDFSGYHAFARTYAEHLANARKYRQALNERQIMN
jgi:UPF0755 protein